MIESIECPTWAAFKHLLADTVYGKKPASRGTFLFRGHGNSDWLLAPSFDRTFVDFKGEERDKLEDALIKSFKKVCEGEKELKELMNEEVAALALAQHHGLPTRLLDWTESPYVAAFFAFQGHFQDAMFGRSLGDTIAIWILDPDSYIWKQKHGVEVISPATWDNERMRKQAGWFTWSRTPFRSLDDYVEHFKKTEHFKNADDALRMITIPSTEAKVAIPDLDLMGINHASLFPDLTGRARCAVTRTLLTFKVTA